jgi:LacI family transcriptional regulator
MYVTIKDIAKKANVSITTVSRVLNKEEGVGDETRARILKIIEESGYRPNAVARGLVTKKTNTLGLILPDISNPFFPDIVRGAEDASNKYGYNIILCNTDDSLEKEKTCINILKEKCVDGIMYTSTIQTHTEHIKNLTDGNIPYVLLDRYFNDKSKPIVYTDGKLGMYKMATYLLENGHRKIAYISGPKESITAGMRFQGYLKALDSYGIELNKKLVRYGDYKMKSGIECAKELLNFRNEFTAIICENDLMAVGALEVLNNMKIKVPDEVSITGFDNIFLSNVTFPKLTTVAQPTYDLGFKAAELLIIWMEVALQQCILWVSVSTTHVVRIESVVPVILYILNKFCNGR